jgi:FkbM family methyltransferase
MGTVMTTSPARARRRTDGDGVAVSWAARRAIAEEAASAEGFGEPRRSSTERSRAYRLFVESGRDVSAAPSCWHAAEARHSRAGRSESDTDRMTLLPGWRGRAIEGVVRLLQRFDLLWRVNFSVWGTFDRQPIRVPILCGQGARQFAMGERWMLTLLRSVLARRPGTFIDVGVNLGQTLLKVKLIDPGRRYCGFEPNPQAYQYTSALVRQNGFANCRLYPIGLAASADIAMLFSKADADPSASIVAGFRPPARYSQSHPVAVFAGDTFAREFGNEVAAVKIDVEGGELDVLQGLQATVTRYRPVILCEILPVFEHASETGRFRLRRQREVESLLSQWQYRIFRIHLDGTLSELDEIEAHADLTRCNYLFAPV